MDLRTYLFSERKTIKAMADSVGCSMIHLAEVKNGRRKPSKSLAMLIERVTKGQVTVKELMKKEDVFEQFDLPLGKV